MRIQTKVFLTVLATSVVLIAVLMKSIQWSLDRELLAYVSARDRAVFEPVLAQLASHHDAKGDWSVFARDRRALDRLVRDARGFDSPPQRPGPGGFGPRRGEGPPGRSRPPPGGRQGPGGRALLLDATGEPVTGRMPPDDFRRLAITSAGETIGFLALPPLDPLLDDFQLEFVAAQREALLVISAIVLFLAGAMALVVAPAIVRPVRRVALGAHQLIHGDYNVSLPTGRGDELGELFRDVNELASTLRENESGRRRWVADISHELRTPVAVLLGEIEAMLDGVRPVSEEQLEVLRQETLQLGKLIEDLGTLAQADIGGLQYRKQDMDLAELVRDRCDAFGPRMADAGLSLSCSLPDKELTIWGDDTRLQQLLDNCLGNSLKYTDAPGSVQVELKAAPGEAVLAISDSAPGVPEDSLDQLFNYLYRVESSRSRETGGSGLGLAIVERVVAGHDGRINARHADAGGITIEIRLPVGEGPDAREVDSDR